MEIQWDTGERMMTPIDLQAKILRNMERERSALPGKGSAVPKAYGELFCGLKPGDFAEDVTGTHWRAREQLGGAVTSLLKVTEPFDSWSIYHRAQIHWGSVARYRLISPWLQTKFFVHVTAEELLYGLYLERTDLPTDNQEDWKRFVAWAENLANRTWLHDVLRRTGGAMRNPYLDYPRQAFAGPITAEEGGSFRYRPQQDSALELQELAPLLAGVPADRYVNLVISQVLAREEAVALGVGISNAIADFFNALLPVYNNKQVALQ